MAQEAYLLDTSIASIAGYEGDERHARVREWLDGLQDDAVYISAVSVAESEYGLNLNPLDAQSQQEIRNAIGTYQVLPIDHHTARVYGSIRASLFRACAPRNYRNRITTRYIEDLREPTSGKELGIQENDLWIVSVAVQYNMVLVTADGRGGMRKIVEEAKHAHRTMFWT